MNPAIFLSYFAQASRRLPILPLAVGLLTLSLNYPATAQERLLRTLTVTGRGVEMIPTTMTQVQLGVEVQAKTAILAQEEAARRSTTVVEFLRSRNVAKLQTTGIRLNPNYSNDNNVQRIIGYRAINTVSFKIPTEQAGAILDEAVQAGATRIDRISFTASDSVIAVAQKEALREATQDAQQQADVVLSTLNLIRKDIVTIQINGATPPQSQMPLFAATTKLTGQVTIPIIGGEQEVQASVTLQISY